MRLEALTECDGQDKWHRILSIDHQPDDGRIFISIAHGEGECDFMECTSSISITFVKEFREKKGG